MSRRALVTGAEGFVGGYLCRHLEAQGWEVHGGVHPSFEIPGRFPCDVCDEAQIERLLEWAGPVTHVFHLAAIAFVPEASRDPARAFDVNLGGTVRLASAVRERRPEARFVFISSSTVYGVPQVLPVDEDHPLDPQNPYDISKAAADHYCRFLHKSAGLDAIRIRPFNHSGPGQSPAFVLPSFAKQVAEIEAGLAPPRLRVGNLEARRDFSHVGDVVRAYELAALRGCAGSAYNVCQGRAYPIREALEGFRALARVPIEVEVDQDRLRAIDVEEVAGSHERLTRDTGWQPEIPFERLLADLLDYWRQQVGVHKAPSR